MIVWNHPFMFTSNEEKDAMFSDADAAIIIEFYPFSKGILSIFRKKNKNLLVTTLTFKLIAGHGQ